MVRFVLRDACPVCEEAGQRALYRVPFAEPPVWGFLASYYAGRIARSELADARFEIRECAACRFLWQAWHLDAEGMQRLYEEWISADESLEKKTRADVALYDAYAREVSSISRRLARRPADIRVLDFGMGWGAWCRMAQAYGYQVEGFELSARRCNWARSQGIRVVASLEALGRYDFVNCHHALEHVPDPHATLVRLVQALAPGGILRLSVPDGRGMAERVLAPDWRPGKDALHPLEHLNCFTPDTLERLARRVGLASVAEPLPELPPLRALRRRVLSALRGPRSALRGTTGCFARVGA